MFVKSIKAAALAAVIAAPISAQAAQAVRASSATLSAPTASSDLTTATRAGPVMPDSNQLEGTPLWLVLLALGVVIVGGIILFDGDGDASPN